MIERQPDSEPTPTTTTEPFRVLLVDNDRDVTDLVTAILDDEGYEVSAIEELDHESIARAVGRVEPDCLLLDSADGPEFGGSWTEAAYMSHRARKIPTIMFTAHADDAAEAREGASDRSMAAGFAAIVLKPFALDELVEAVATAVGRSVRFDRSEEGERERTESLVAELRAAGATDITTSSRREWATFTLPNDDRISQVYWWQRHGAYIVGRYDADAHLSIVGQFHERPAAIAAALG